MERYYNSQFPIIEAVMNGGSSLQLALACHEAGVFPSLYFELFNVGPNPINYDLFDSQLGEYIKATGTSDVLLGLPVIRLADPATLKIIKSRKISHIEFLEEGIDLALTGDPNSYLKSIKDNFDNIVRSAAEYLYPTKFFRRTYTPRLDPFGFAYSLKGSGAAGLHSDKYTTKQLFDAQKQLTPKAVLIPYGGISSPSEVSYFINNGAAAVAIGSLFAASKESTLADKVKQAMVATTKKDLVVLPDSNQTSLLFSKYEDVIPWKFSNIDWNRQRSLTAGLTTGTQGHMYLGASVDAITEIKSVKEIVEYLISEL